jgi:hypothetical protein
MFEILVYKNTLYNSTKSVYDLILKGLLGFATKSLKKLSILLAPYRRYRKISLFICKKAVKPTAFAIIFV